MSLKKKFSFIGRSLLTLSVVGLLGGALAYYMGYRVEDLEKLTKKYIPFLYETNDSLVVDSLVVDSFKSVEKVMPKPEVVVENLELLPNPVNPFVSIDAHARKCPSTKAQTIESLAAYLAIPCSNDLEKARAIYVWLTQFISYDDAAYNSKNYGDYSAEGVLKARKAVCEGFSNLYQALGKAMNLKIRKVSGYAKGYGYKPGQRFTESTHAWNVIKIENDWRIFDATWGEGSGTNVKGKLKSSKKFKDYWFNTDPYEAVFSHFPENPGLAYVKPIIDVRTFELLPKVDKGYFQMGFRGSYAFKQALANKNLQFPKSYSYDFHVKVKRAPPFKYVKTGKTSSFRFFIPRAYNVALMDSKRNWVYLERIDGVFEIEYTPKHPGPLSVYVKTSTSGSYSGILGYEIRK